jgi:hypothetical protein
MNTFRAIMFAAAISYSTGHAISGEKIEGAFGLKLGDVFDTATAARTDTSTISTSGGPFVTETTCWLKLEAVPNPHEQFREVYVVITPKTHRIVKIVGRGYNPAPDDQQQVEKLLKGKYETIPVEKDSPLKRNIMAWPPVIYQGNRYIEVRQAGTVGIYVGASPTQFIELRYVDQELEKLAAKEAAELKFQNKSGL